MSETQTKESDTTTEPPDPEDVPVFEGQVVFKGNFESDNNAKYGGDEE